MADFCKESVSDYREVNNSDGAHSKFLAMLMETTEIPIFAHKTNDMTIYGLYRIHSMCMC